MPEHWRHGGNLVIGTTAERVAFDTSTLRPDNRWFDTDLSAWLLWDGTQFVHRFADNVILYDDAGDSPSFSFVGGSNEDTITMFLADNALAGQSDMVIRLADAAALSRFEIQDSATVMRAWINSDGNAYLAGTLGLGTETVPHGAIGYAKLALDGAATNAAGPHIQTTISTDDYPTFQLLSWDHDNVALNFDSYWQAAFKSSDVGSNFQIYKQGDTLQFRVDSGIAQGANVTWDSAMIVDTASYLGLSITPTVRLDIYGVTQAASTVRIHREQATTDGATLILNQTRGGATGGVAGDDLGYIQFEGHSGTAADRIYAQVDAEIVDPTNTLEDGRLYLRTRQGGALQSALELTTYGLINNLTDIRATGSAFPDLGTGTLAEMLGDVYLGTDKDLYARRNQRGTFFNTDASIPWDTHFDEGAMPAGWAWAAAPFVTPGTVNHYYSVVESLHNAVARWFLYTTFTVANNFVNAQVGINAAQVGNYAGLRLDDGTDNNYVELEYLISATSPMTWDIQIATRVGAGARVVASPITLAWPAPVCFRMQIYGTKWTNWNVAHYLLSMVGVHAFSPWRVGTTVGLTWTPSRTGGIFYNVSGTTYFAYYMESFKQN